MFLSLLSLKKAIFTAEVISGMNKEWNVFRALDVKSLSVCNGWWFANRNLSSQGEQYFIYIPQQGEEKEEINKLELLSS